MYLPWMRYSAKIPEYNQVRFGGIERGKASGDGSIYDMQNISTDDYPVLSAVPNRKVSNNLHDKLWYYGCAEKEFVIAGESEDFENETWVLEKTYDEGTIVGYNGLFYIATRAVTGNATTATPDTASEYWKIYTNITFTYDEVWNYWHEYRVGDVVNHGTKYYRSKTGRNIKLYSDTANWIRLNSTTKPTYSDYSNNTDYKANEVYVYYNGDYHLCIKNAKGVSPTNTEYWKNISWDYSKSYNIGDYVIYRPGDGYRYLLQNKSGENTSPETDGANWEPYTYASFYYDGQRVEGLHLSPEKKECAYLNGYIVILPDNVYYRVDDGTFGYLNGTKSGSIDTRDYRGIYYNKKKFDYPLAAGLAADTSMNKIKLGFWGGNTLMDANDYANIDLTRIFRAGDAVEVNQNRQKAHDEYAIIRNGTYYVESVSECEITFTASAFAAADIGEDALVGGRKWYYLGDIMLSKGMPELDFLCVSNNRMWGCHEDTVYSSALGDVFIWKRYSGLETDPVYIESADLGSFTGCCEYNGYPLFFKENEMYRVYGSTASTFALQKVSDYGLRKDSPHAIAIADSVLYFLSDYGICAYTGGVPAVISDELKRDFSEGIFGTDGKKLYASVNEGDERKIYVYDTRNRIWSSETYEDVPLSVVNFNGELKIVNAQGNLTLLSKPRSEWQNEADTQLAMIEFNDFYDDVISDKRVGGIIIRASVDPEYDALEIYVQYDSDGEWHKVGSIYNQNSRKQISEFRFFPRKCDHYRLRLECRGKFTLYALARQVE